MFINMGVSLLFLFLSLKLASKANSGRGKINHKAIIIAVLAFGLVMRLVLSVATEGYGTDIALFKAWARSIVDVGCMEVYHTGLYLDYPPGFLYVLGFMEELRRLFGMAYEGQGFTMLIKLPSVIADVVLSYIIYNEGKKYVKPETAVYLSAAFLFCPAVIINSTIWGQADAWCLMLLVFSLLYLANYKEGIIKYLLSGAFYGLALISKPQMLIFAPVYLFYTIAKKKWGGLFAGIGSAIVLALAVSKPFTAGFDFTWLIDKYRTTMDYYAYYSINAYNFWDMLGKNWGHLPEGGFGLFVLNWAGPLLATVFAGVVIFRGIKKNEKALIYAVSAVLIFTVYIFSVKMHERYIFPALILILLTYALSAKRIYLYIFSGLSFVHFLNVSYVLYLNNTYVSPTSPQIIVLSFLHVLMYLIFMAAVFCDFVTDIDSDSFLVVKKKHFAAHFTAEEPTAVKEKKGIIELDTDADSRKLLKADIIIMLAITVLYGILAFTNLGGHVTANTTWKAKEGDTAVLKAEEDIKGIKILPGIDVSDDGNRYKVGVNIAIDYSHDGKKWTELTTVDKAAVYEWKQLDYQDPFAEYIRVRVLDDSTVINEIGFVGGDGEYTVKATDVNGNAPELVDEQDTVPVHTSYMNSTYFDEIYHARTAYEFVLGVESYENTHPTLGKLIIALGIMMFGMNPFGWRFMGTLLGVLMLPIFYHLLKRLFGSTKLSTLGTIVFALDFMHFVQTRIATIDTYAVFFILLMYDAMLVFVQMDINKEPVKKILLPLGLSGFFMGLGMASKWTCVYAALGLAIMYFTKLFANAPKGERERYDYVTKCLTLCIWCVLFFIAIPFGIYFAAFLPLTLQPQNRYDVFGRFISYQQHMFNYHSQLESEHYFASPWYEWPLDIRNIWYSIDRNVDGMGGVSTITCMGSPAVWWAGLVSIIAMIPVYIKKRTDYAFTALCGFIAVYLPWVLISRLTFVYHYFTAVPFIVIAITACVKLLGETKLGTPLGGGVLAKINIAEIIFFVFTIIVAALFVVYYPVLSGSPTTDAYIKALEFMPHWYFG